MTAAEGLALLRTLAPECKTHGIRRLKIGELEIEFGATGDVNTKLIEQFSQAFNKGFPSEEEVLFHSAPGFVPKDAQEEPIVPVKTARGRKGNPG